MADLISRAAAMYPTWAEWLVAQDIITEYGRIECGGSGTCGIFTDKGENPIPADIAQKLGIEPIEANTKRRMKDIVCGGDGYGE